MAAAAAAAAKVAEVKVVEVKVAAGWCWGETPAWHYPPGFGTRPSCLPSAVVAVAFAVDVAFLVLAVDPVVLAVDPVVVAGTS